MIGTHPKELSPAAGIKQDRKAHPLWVRARQLPGTHTGLLPSC